MSFHGRAASHAISITTREPSFAKERMRPSRDIRFSPKRSFNCSESTFQLVRKRRSLLGRYRNRASLVSRVTALALVRSIDHRHANIPYDHAVDQQGSHAKFQGTTARAIDFQCHWGMLEVPPNYLSVLRSHRAVALASRLVNSADELAHGRHQPNGSPVREQAIQPSSDRSAQAMHRP